MRRKTILCVLVLPAQLLLLSSLTPKTEAAAFAVAAWVCHVSAMSAVVATAAGAIVVIK